MAFNTCSNIDSWFQSESGRFSVDVRDRIIQTSPWQRFTKVGKFPLGMGTTISDLTIERILTTSVETDWTAAAINTGSGIVNSACLPSPTDLEFGHTVRTWSLENKSYQTPCICLDDLKSNFSVGVQVNKTVDALTQLTQYVLDNRYRAGYISACSQIVSLRPNLPTGTAINAALPPPTYGMSQTILDKYRRLIIRNGGGRNALGMENGGPVFGYITSDEASDDIIRANSDVRQDIRFAQPSALVAPLGVERSFRGWYHIIDPFLPRFTYTQGQAQPWTRVAPFVSSAATDGTKWEPNPDYEAAPYELQYAYHQDVMEVMVNQVGPDIPDAPFVDMPEYYTGQFIWINIRDRTVNPLGKIGNWLAVFSNAIRPNLPTLGYCFMAKRCVATPTGTTCQYS